MQAYDDERAHRDVVLGFDRHGPARGVPGHDARHVPGQAQVDWLCWPALKHGGVELGLLMLTPLGRRLALRGDCGWQGLDQVEQEPGCVMAVEGEHNVALRPSGQGEQSRVRQL